MLLHGSPVQGNTAIHLPGILNSTVWSPRICVNSDLWLCCCYPYRISDLNLHFSYLPSLFSHRSDLVTNCTTTVSLPTFINRLPNHYTMSYLLMYCLIIAFNIISKMIITSKETARIFISGKIWPQWSRSPSPPFPKPEVPTHTHVQRAYCYSNFR